MSNLVLLNICAKFVWFLLKKLENENEFLYDDLTSQMQEVKQIESEVIEVSKLTQIFAENIVSQLSTIETIHKSAVETNSNLTLGNENIKEVFIPLNNK